MSKEYECPECDDFTLEPRANGDYWCPECGKIFSKIDIEAGAKEIK